MFAGAYSGVWLVCFPALWLLGMAVWGIIRRILARKCPRLGGLILVGGGVLLLLLSLYLSHLETDRNLHLYVGGRGLYEWQKIIRTLMAACLAAGCVLLAVKKVRSLRTLVVFLLAGVWFCMCAACLLFMQAEAVYTEVSSPASAGEVHELVFEEKSWLFGGSGAVYERVSPCFVKKLGDYTTDDGSCPVAGGVCDFTWKETGFSMHYQFEASFSYLP